jgi:AmmeMemoRadiSam system protein A
MKSGNFMDFLTIDENLSEKGSDCGLNSFIIMSGMLNKKSVQPEFYSYEGPLGVGYAICAYKISGDDETRDFINQYADIIRKNTQTIRDKEDDYVRLARETLEYYIAEGHMPPLPENLPDELYNDKAGAFVSIKKHGQLRGCIGTTEPTQINIAREIQQNAISSGTRDPRFPAVSIEELPELIYSVDVLSPAYSCKKEDLDLKRYGVIVTSGYKRGLLLPNLDGVDTIDEQIDIARKKAGIGAFDKYTLERFEVVRHT